MVTLFGCHIESTWYNYLHSGVSVLHHYPHTNLLATVTAATILTPGELLTKQAMRKKYLHI
jgi:hypothetical protein